MPQISTIKRSFKSLKEIKPFYTGGPIDVSYDGSYLLCSLTEQLTIVRVADGQLEKTLDTNAGVITSIVASPVAPIVVVCSRSLLIQVWNYETQTLLRSFKAHEAPVLCSSFSADGEFFATGSADSLVKVFKLSDFTCHANFRGHSGIVSAIRFDSYRPFLYSASDSGEIRVWNLKKKSSAAYLENHASVVRDFLVTENYLISAGRDQILSVWDVNKWTLKHTLPVFESIETIGLYGSHEERPIVYTGGETGDIRFWDMLNSAEIKSHKVTMTNNSIYTILQKNNVFLLAATDQTIHLLDNTAFPQKISIEKSFSGYNDEILSLVPFEHESTMFVAVSTNSELIKVYNLDNMSCSLLDGHDDTVLTLDATWDGDILASGSKDNRAIVWKWENGQFALLHECIGHTGAVNAVALAPKTSQFVISGSGDRTVKMWSLKKPKIQQLSAEYTFQAHDKEINAIKIAPNEKIFATSSQDKTIKLWNVQDGSFKNTLKGHKRGVWDIAFSPVEQVLVSGSGDKTVKIWSLTDYTCLKTFEGHMNSVIQVGFSAAGTQLISSGADSLIKVWSIKSGESICDLDDHEDRIWAVRQSKDEKYLISGGADSKIVVWEDRTQEELEEMKKEEEGRIEQEQHLNTFLMRKDFVSAIKLAIKLDKPFQLLNIFKKINRNEEYGIVYLDEILDQLSQNQMSKLLTYIQNWNTSGKFSSISQSLLYSILKRYNMDDLMEMKEIKSILTALLPYTEKHYEKAKKLQNTAYLLDHIIDMME